MLLEAQLDGTVGAWTQIHTVRTVRALRGISLRGICETPVLPGAQVMLVHLLLINLVLIALFMIFILP